MTETSPDVNEGRNVFEKLAMIKGRIELATLVEETLKEKLGMKKSCSLMELWKNEDALMQLLDDPIYRDALGPKAYFRWLLMSVHNSKENAKFILETISSEFPFDKLEQLELDKLKTEAQDTLDGRENTFVKVRRLRRTIAELREFSKNNPDKSHLRRRLCNLVQEGRRRFRVYSSRKKFIRQLPEELMNELEKLKDELKVGL